MNRLLLEIRKCLALPGNRFVITAVVRDDRPLHPWGDLAETLYQLSPLELDRIIIEAAP